ncbi:MAG: hypothetical protein WCD43_19575 [Candidatus Acidiferrales bacterium]
MSAIPPQPPMYSPAQPARRNNAIWWILGIVAAGIIVMFLFGVTLAGLFIHHLKVRNSGDKVDIQTALGAISVDRGGAHITGLEVYPGASPSSDDKGANVNLSANDTGVGIATEQYQTKDPIDFVQAWYRKRLGPDFRLEANKGVPDHSNGPVIMNESDVAFVDDHRNGVRVVALKKISEGTQITLVRIGKKETQ